MLAVFSHELTNLVGASMMQSDSLRDTLLQAQIQRPVLLCQLDRLARAHLRLRRVLDDMAGYSRCASHQLLPLHLASVNLREVIDVVVAERQPELEHAKIQLDIPASLPPLLADADRLTQIVVNLVDNAIKYAGRAFDLRISAHVVTSEPWVLLAISDTGPGIPGPLRERLFRPFCQIRPDRSWRSRGLGLYICRTICRQHGGEMWLDGKVGATICSLWPVHPGDLDARSPAVTAPDLEGFGSRLRERREAILITRRELARMAGIAESTVRNIERGRTQPSRRILVRMQRVPILRPLFEKLRLPTKG